MIDLTLKLEDKTVRKLRALAMLSGKTVGSLEKEFSSFFDKMLTQEIAKYLEIDVTAPLSLIDVEGESEGEGEEDMDEPTEESQEPFGELGHSLSGDEDEGQESLEEQAAKLAASVKRTQGREIKFEETAERESGLQFNINVPSAGDDAEAFLDEVLGAPEYQDEYDTQKQMNSRPVQAKLGGAGRRAKVADFTGYESNSF